MIAQLRKEHEISRREELSSPQRIHAAVDALAATLALALLGAGWLAMTGCVATAPGKDDSRVEALRVVPELRVPVRDPGAEEREGARRHRDGERLRPRA